MRSDRNRRAGCRYLAACARQIHTRAKFCFDNTDQYFDVDAITQPVSFAQSVSFPKPVPESVTQSVSFAQSVSDQHTDTPANTNAQTYTAAHGRTHANRSVAYAHTRQHGHCNQRAECPAYRHDANHVIEYTVKQ